MSELLTCQGNLVSYELWQKSLDTLAAIELFAGTAKTEGHITLRHHEEVFPGTAEYDYLKAKTASPQTYPSLYLEREYNSKETGFFKKVGIKAIQACQKANKFLLKDRHPTPITKAIETDISMQDITDLVDDLNHDFVELCQSDPRDNGVFKNWSVSGDFKIRSKTGTPLNFGIIELNRYNHAIEHKDWGFELTDEQAFSGDMIYWNNHSSSLVLFNSGDQRWAVLKNFEFIDIQIQSK